MSLFVPFHRGVQTSYSFSNAQPASAIGHLLTASASLHTLGTKVELFSSTAHDTYWVRIAFFLSQSTGTQTDMLCNIYVGASSAETVIIPNLLCGWSESALASTRSRVYEFPVFIPAGTRISADNQALISGDTVRITMELFGGGQQFGWCGRGVEAIGVSTAASQGTTITPGTASEGDFTNIGTTANEWKYVLPALQGTLTDTTTANNIIDLDIGVGGAVLNDLRSFLWYTTTNEGAAPLIGGRGRFTIIPAGTTLQLRSQNSTTAEDHDVAIYGVY